MDSEAKEDHAHGRPAAVDQIGQKGLGVATFGKSGESATTREYHAWEKTNIH